MEAIKLKKLNSDELQNLLKDITQEERIKRIDKMRKVEFKKPPYQWPLSFYTETMLFNLSCHVHGPYTW